MPLGAPEIVGPVSTCSRQIPVRGQFTGATVRLYIDGDSTPVADATAGWSDATINVDQARLALAPEKILRATQELGGETSDRSAVGVPIEKAGNAPVTFPDTLYACAQSLFLTNCIPGAKIEVWQAGSMLGLGEAIGDHCWVNLATGRRIVAGSLVDARQTICTSPVPLTTTSQMPVSPVPRQTRKLASPALPRLHECQETVDLSAILSGAVVRLTRGGSPVWDATIPVPSLPIIVGRLSEGEEISVTQSMPLCELAADKPNTVRVEALTSLGPPIIEGPVCASAHKVKFSNLVPPAVLRVFADGTEIGRWQAGLDYMEPDLNIPAPPVTLTARQELCGIESPMSRSYTISSGRSGRWFVVEDGKGGNLQAPSFAIHAALARTGKVVMISGDQHNSDQNKAKDFDHCELFDTTALKVQRIDAPTTESPRFS